MAEYATMHYGIPLKCARGRGCPVPPDPRIDFVKTDPNAVTPKKEHLSDSGFDVTILKVYKEISPQVKLYDTGLKFAPPPGIYLELFARSSLMKRGYMLANNVGIIDNSYRGNLLVALYKFDTSAPEIELPARVAQLIPKEVLRIPMWEQSELLETERGEGGFGSTGN